jgi:auxin efflux carrier family protein
LSLSRTPLLLRRRPSQVLLPLIGIAVVMYGLQSGIIRAPDAFFSMVLLLNFSMPTAINIQTIAVMHGYAELETSALLFYQYAASVVTLPFFIFLFMKILGV